MAAVGLGSTLFHTLANVWSRWADVLPIAAALLWALWLFLTRAARFSARGAAAGFAAYIALTIAFGLLVPSRAVNGSNTYFSSEVALVAMGGMLSRRSSANAGNFYVAALLFALSLVCRSVDLALCAPLPVGTHFLWHLLNGAALYAAGRGLLREIATGRPPSPPLVRSPAPGPDQ